MSYHGFHVLIGWIGGMVFAVILAGAVLSAVVLKRSHHPFVLREMKTAVDGLLGLGSLLVLLPSLEFFYGMYMAWRAIATAHTGDPRIIMDGIAQVVEPFFAGLTGFIIVYAVWGFLRLMQGRAVERLADQPRS